MGMFDYVVCEHNLPDGFNASGIKFQTKDLVNELDTFTISDDGRLIHHYRELESTPDNELPHPEMPFIGCLREKAGSQKLVDTNHHGYLEFYASNISGSGPKGFITENDETPWTRCYTAKFTDGQLVSITLDSDKVDMGDCKHILRKDF
jgi:hypothetical protein